MSDKKIRQLVLDAGPLITQSATTLQQYAHEFFTTPGVHSELKDEQARNQLILWTDNLKIRHPKQEYIKKVESFAKLTGDFSVLSANDIHIIALAYELEVEQNGTWRLRKYPGEKIEHKKSNENKEQDPETEKVEQQAEKEQAEKEPTTEKQQTSEKHADEKSQPASETCQQLSQSQTAKKPRRRGGKKQREKREAQIQKDLDQPETSTPSEINHVTEKLEQTTIEEPKDSNQIEPEILEDYYDDDDDGDWITPDNLQEEMLKDNNEEVKDTKSIPLIKVALSTGDFACQNVAMQIGINLMNSMSGRQIQRIRNYMYRCHACFRLTPMSKTGKPKHFCPKCGGDTLLRCAVSIDNNTGKITPHLKANFQWINRGNKYSLPSPLSKNQRKIQGNSGYQHNKDNRHKTLQNPLLLREDQKEYQKAVKDDAWQRKKNDKLLQEWVGGGSADNYISPFNSVPSIRPSGVKTGKGRYVNSTKSRRQ